MLRSDTVRHGIHSPSPTFAALHRAFLLLIFIAIIPQPSRGQDVIRVRGDNNFPPYAFLNDHNQPAGFSVDLIRAVAEVMGLNIEIEMGVWSKIRTSLEKGQIDIITGMNYSPQREHAVNFSVPHLIVSTAIFIRRGSDIKGVDDLKDREIIVQEYDIMHDYLLEQNITERIIPVTDITEGLRLLARGRHDCALLTKLNGLYVIRQHQIRGLTTVAPPLTRQRYCFAVTEGNNELLSALNEGLSIVKTSGQYQDLHEKWFGAYDEDGPSLRDQLKRSLVVLIPLLVLLILALAWSRGLKRTVSRKTAELIAQLDERERMESELHEKNRQMETLFANLPGMAYRTRNEPTWPMDFVSEGSLPLIGYPPYQLTDGTFCYGDFIHPADRQQVWENIQESIRQHRHFQILYRLRSAEGDYRWVLERGTGIWDTDGNLWAIEGFVGDITEIKQAQKALQHSERQLRQIVEQNSIATFILDRHHRVTHWNLACSQISNISADKMVGTQDHWQAFYPTPRPILADLVLDHSPPERFHEFYGDSAHPSPLINDAWETEVFIPEHGRDGLWLYLTAALIRDAAGNPTAAMETIQDITERKEAEEAIRKQSLILSERIKELNCLYNLSRLAEQQDLSLPALFQETLALIPPAWQHPSITCAQISYDDQIYATHDGYEAPWELTHEIIVNRRRAGSLHVGYRKNLSGSEDPFLDEERQLLNALAERLGMIIEHRQAQEAILVYTEKLEISNRELQDFAYVSSHDLQEPLRKVQTFGDRLKSRYSQNLDERGLDYLERMLSATARMQRLINDLLAFSRVTTKAQPFSPVNLEEITRNVLADLEINIESLGASIQVNPLPTIDAEPTQMHQLLLNLLSNALKFHREDAPPRITVEARIVTLEDDAATEICELSVRDNGIGFDEKYLDRIFGVFQRLHGRGQFEGTGIGLAVCRKIAERHGGTISADSVPGQGSTFTVCLPCRQEKGAIIHE